MHIHIRIFFQQLAGLLQLLWRRSNGKPWRYRIQLTAIAMPALDQIFAVLVAAVGIVAQKFRCIAIHHHLAANHPGIALLGRFKKGINTLFVYRAKHQCGGGATFNQFIQEEICDLTGVLFVFKLTLSRESIVVQPIQQLLTVRGDNFNLREVDMGINHTRHDQVATIIHQLKVLRQVFFNLLNRAGFNHFAVFNDQRTVFKKFVGIITCFIRIIQEVQDTGSINSRARSIHWFSLNSQDTFTAGFLSADPDQSKILHSCCLRLCDQQPENHRLDLSPAPGGARCSYDN